MKKILAIIIAAVMIAACSVTAFAETTNVSYDVQPSYTVAIPASVTLGDAAVTADITASDVILEGGKRRQRDRDWRYRCDLHGRWQQNPHLLRS